MKYELNVPKVDIGSYRHLWRGIPKIGKTTLFRDLIMEEYGKPEAGLLIGVGIELGFKAISNLYGIEAINWGKFVEIVDDLVENPDQNEFQLIAIDTIDQLVDIAEEKVLRIHLLRSGSRAESINSALGGYGRGQKLARKLIAEQLARIERAGYGMVLIGHTKVKDITEKGMDEAYQQLTGSLDGRYEALFTDMVDVIATLVDEKSIEDGRVGSVKRWIYFRSDGFVEAGSRFPNIPERVEMDARNYIDAIEHGIRSSFDGQVSEEKIEKMKKKEVEQRKEEAKKYTEKEKTGSVENADELNTVEDYIKMIGEQVALLEADMKKQKRVELEEDGIDVTAYKDETDIETLKHILKVVMRD